MQISSRSSASGKARLIGELALADGVLQEQHRRLQAEIGGAEANADLDRQRLVQVRDHEHVEGCAEKQHDRRHRAGEQERDIGRVAAIAGHDQLVARGFLRQPFGQVEVFHHLGDDLLRGLAQRHLLRFVEAVALALPEPFALAGDRLHALGKAFAGKQRHDQRVSGRARRDGGEQHGHEPCVVELGDDKLNHAAPSEVEVDHFLHHQDADRHPADAAEQHELSDVMGPKQRDIVGRRDPDQQHHDRRQ